MSIRVRHETTYHYEHAVRRSVQTLRISPPNTARQKVLHWKLDLPAPARAWTDGFGNLSHTLVLDQPHDSILICAQGVVEVQDGDLSEPAGPMPLEVFQRPTALTLMDAAIEAFANPLAHTIRTRPFMGLHDLMLALIDRMPTPAATLGLATRRRRPSRPGTASARTTPTYFWPAPAVWGWRRAT